MVVKIALIIFTAVISWSFLLFGVPGAYAEEFVRVNFDYGKLPKKPFENCSSSELDHLKAALRQVDSQQSKRAVMTAKTVYSLTRKCPQTYETYAWSLFRSGEWLESIRVIDDGIKAFGSYPDLIRRRALMSMEMGELGTTQRTVDGNSVFLSKEKSLLFDENRFKRENYKSSLEDLLYLIKDHPERHEEIFLAAYLYSRLGDYEKSNGLLVRLKDLGQYRDTAAIGMSQNYLMARKYASAEKLLLEMVNRYPKGSSVYALLSLVYRETGEISKAGECEKKAEFYQWVQPFTGLMYSDENYRTIAYFVQANPIKDKEKRLDRIVKGTDRQEAIDVCLTILAVHANHDNGLEDKATRQLIRFGNESVPKTIQLLNSNGVSTCTITNAAEVLSAVKDERGWQPLLDCLPRMTKLPGLLIPPFIPDKIMQFDRNRGVKVLLPFIRDMIRADQDGDDSRDPAQDANKSMVYFAFYHSLRNIDKDALLEMARGFGYSGKESQLLCKGVYEK